MKEYRCSHSESPTRAAWGGSLQKMPHVELIRARCARLGPTNCWVLSWLRCHTPRPGALTRCTQRVVPLRSHSRQTFTDITSCGLSASVSSASPVHLWCSHSALGFLGLPAFYRSPAAAYDLWPAVSCLGRQRTALETPSSVEVRQPSHHIAGSPPDFPQETFRRATVRTTQQGYSAP